MSADLIANTYPIFLTLTFRPSFVSHCAIHRVRPRGRFCTLPADPDTFRKQIIEPVPQNCHRGAPRRLSALPRQTVALKSYRLPRQGGRRSGRDGMVHVSSRGDYLPPGGSRTGRKRAERVAGSHTAARRRWSVLRLSGLLLLAERCDAARAQLYSTACMRTLHTVPHCHVLRIDGHNVFNVFNVI